MSIRHTRLEWKQMQVELNNKKTTGPKISLNLFPIRTKKRLGRNKSCPCDSGLKYKKCCGKV